MGNESNIAEPIIVEESYQPKRTIIDCDNFHVDIDSAGFGKVMKDGVEMKGVVALTFSFDHDQENRSLPMVQITMYPDIHSLHHGKRKGE